MAVADIFSREALGEINQENFMPRGGMYRWGRLYS